MRQRIWYCKISSVWVVAEIQNTLFGVSNKVLPVSDINDDKYDRMINSAHNFKISGSTVASCPLYNRHKCFKKGQKSLTKLDIFKITSKNGNCALESKGEIKCKIKACCILILKYSAELQTVNMKRHERGAVKWVKWCVDIKLLCSPTDSEGSYWLTIR